MNTIKLKSLLAEAISPEERKKYVDYGKMLKKYLQSKYKIKLKSDVSKSKRPNPYIRFFGEMPNDLRVKVMKGLGQTPLDWDNVNYGNIRANYIALNYSQWKDLMDKKSI
jgi:hypothetical protein